MSLRAVFVNGSDSGQSVYVWGSLQKTDSIAILALYRTLHAHASRQPHKCAHHRNGIRCTAHAHAPVEGESSTLRIQESHQEIGTVRDETHGTVRTSSPLRGWLAIAGSGKKVQQAVKDSASDCWGALLCVL